MKIPTKVSRILDHLESNGFEAFVVGGCVRDSILGISPSDWDICTSAHPEDVQSIFQDFFVIPTGLKHGTVTVVSENMPIEITTFRKDGAYLDHRHPESVCFTTDIREDLKRRDFTINAMAYSPKSGLIDFFDGKKHLEEKLLCCVGDPQKRFSEDSLRILRGLRFAATFDLTIEPQTARAIHAGKDGLSSISAERILVEFRKIILAQHFQPVLAEYSDVLGIIFPDCKGAFDSSDLWNVFVQKLSTIPPSFPLRFSALLDWCYQKGNSFEVLNKMIHGLKLDKKTYQHIAKLMLCLRQTLPETLAETRRFAGKYGMEILEELIALRNILFDEDNTTAKNFMQEIQKTNLCYNLEHLAISGKDLRERGLSGANIGATLTLALDAVIDGKVLNTKESLLNFLFS